MKSKSGFYALLLLTFASGSAVYGAAAMPAPPELFTLPPSEDHHIIKIERHGTGEVEAKMIAAAEAAKAQTGAATVDKQSDMAGGVPAPLAPPYALTGKALAELKERVERYRKTTFTYLPESGLDMSEGDEVGSSLTYSASVKKHDELQVKGESRQNVYVVDLSLSFVARQVEGGPFLSTVCGFPEELSFRKTRRVILDSKGTVLSIEGDGASPLQRKPIATMRFGDPYEKLGVALKFVDREGAKLWARSIPDEGVRSRVLQKVSEGEERAKKAVAEAKAWALSGEVSPAHNHRAAVIGPSQFYQIVSADLASHGHQVSVGACYQCKEVSVARTWAPVAPQEAGAWALTIKDPLARNGALHSVVSIWALRSPEELAAWLRKHIEPASKRDLFLIDVIYQRAEDAPSKVVRLLPHLENKELRKFGRHYIVDRWAYKQPWLALKMALEIEDANKRVALLKNIARNWSYHGNAENAKQWASRIPNEAERAQYLGSIKPRR